MSKYYYVICEQCRNAVDIQSKSDISSFLREHSSRCHGTFIVADDSSPDETDELVGEHCIDDYNKLKPEGEYGVPSHYRESKIYEKRLTFKKVLDQHESRISYLEESYKNAYALLSKIYELKNRIIDLEGTVNNLIVKYYIESKKDFSTIIQKMSNASILELAKSDMKLINGE